jgi:hypothetical protein
LCRERVLPLAAARGAVNAFSGGGGHREEMLDTLPVVFEGCER